MPRVFLPFSPLLLLLLLSPTAACESAVIRPFDEDTTTPPADSAVDSAPADTRPVDPNYCAGAQLPERPGTEFDGDDGEERIFIFTDWILFPDNPNNGINLDQRCTVDEETSSCVKGVGALIVDQPDGIDNAYGAQLASQAESLFMLTGRNPEADLHALQRRGTMDLLLRIRGWSGEPDDRSITVDFMQTVCGHLAGEDDCDPAVDRTAPLAFDGTDVFYVSRESLDPTDPTIARVIQNNAYVSGGTLVAKIPDNAALSFPVEAGLIDVSLRDAYLTGTLPPDVGGSAILNGRISGRWPLGSIQTAIDYFALCPAGIDPRRAAIDSNLAAALDIMSDPALDNMALTCDAISATLTMDGYFGSYGGHKEQVRLPAGCMGTP